jgi:L-fuconolactonase
MTACDGEHGTDPAREDPDPSIVRKSAMSSPPQVRLSRREFLLAGATISGGSIIGSTRAPSITRVIDTHTHFYDPRRFLGVPWPPKNDALLYRPVYPEEFRRLAGRHNVTGTVVVEASSRVDDNRWLLDLAARDRFLLGVVGFLAPGSLWFRLRLRRFATNPLFRGIRVGVWHQPALAGDPHVTRDLKRLADHDLALDVLTAPDRLQEVARLAGAIPVLRIVVNHCASVRIDGSPPPAAWLDGLRACAPHPNVFMKVSGLVEGTGRTDGTAPAAPAFYRPILDAIWDAFGPDRVIFASDWPVCSRFATYATVFAIVDNYFSDKGKTVAQKYFSENSIRAYKLATR